MPRPLAPYTGETVRLATTVNIDLDLPPAIDGKTLVANDKVLVKDQTDPTQNGIYNVRRGKLSRPLNEGVIASGQTLVVQEGNTNHDKMFVLTTDNPINLDETALVYEEFSAGGGGSDLAADNVWTGTNAFNDEVTIDGDAGGIMVINHSDLNWALATAADQVYNARVDGESVIRTQVLADGTIKWGDGTNALDTTLYRSDVGTLTTDGSLVIQENLALNGNLSSDVDMGNNRIFNLVDPDNQQDAATKQYVDDNAGAHLDVSNTWTAQQTFDSTTVHEDNSTWQSNGTDTVLIETFGGITLQNEGDTGARVTLGDSTLSLGNGAGSVADLSYSDGVGGPTLFSGNDIHGRILRADQGADLAGQLTFNGDNSAYLASGGESVISVTGSLRNTAAPTDDADLANKAYVDSVSGAALLPATNTWSGTNTFTNDVSIDEGQFIMTTGGTDVIVDITGGAATGQLPGDDQMRWRIAEDGLTLGDGNGNVANLNYGDVGVLNTAGKIQVGTPPTLGDDVVNLSYFNANSGVQRQTYLYDFGAQGGAQGQIILTDLNGNPQQIPAHAIIFGMLLQPIVSPTSGGAATISVDINDPNWGVACLNGAEAFTATTYDAASTNWLGYLGNGPTPSGFAPLTGATPADAAITVAGADLTEGKFIFHVMYLPFVTA